jgi:GntR family transcriptional repressor for pyruvate dehydrogenase complex
VSRPVLREAVNRLAAIGLLSVRHGSGTYVAGKEWLSSCTKLAGSSLVIGRQEMLQFIEFRRVIESYAAPRAATMITLPQEGELEKLFETAVGIVPRTFEEGVEADLRFHGLLIEIGGNPLMRNIMELLHEFAVASMMRTQPEAMLNTATAQAHNSASYKVHADIMAAIRQHSPEAATKAIHAHMDLVVERLTASEGSEAAEWAPEQLPHPPPRGKHKPT